MPMPKGFEHLLPLILSGSRLEQDNYTISPIKTGIPQGGIISHLFE